MLSLVRSNQDVPILQYTLPHYIPKVYIYNLVEKSCIFGAFKSQNLDFIIRGTFYRLGWVEFYRRENFRIIFVWKSSFWTKNGLLI